MPQAESKSRCDARALQRPVGSAAPPGSADARCTASAKSRAMRRCMPSSRMPMSAKIVRLLLQARKDDPDSAAAAAFQHLTQCGDAAAVDQRDLAHAQDENARRLEELVQHVVEAAGDREE